MSRMQHERRVDLPGGSGQRQRPRRAPRASTNHDGCTTRTVSGAPSRAARSARSPPSIHRSVLVSKQAYSPRETARR